MKTKNDTWEKFLVRNHFQEVAEASSSSPRIPKRSRRRGKEITAQETAVVIEETAQETAEETVQETAQEIVQEERKKGDRTKRQKGDKVKAIVQESFPSPEPSIEEESQTLADRLVQLQATALSKRKQKEKHSAQQKSTNVQVRRSSRLKGKLSVTKGKQSHFVDLGTPEKTPIQLDVELSPPREESPFQQERESSLQEFEFRPRQTPDIDHDQ